MKWFNFDELTLMKHVWQGELNRIFHTDNVTIMKFNGKKGYKFHDDGHESEQITILLKGKFKFYVDKQTHIMKKWDAVFIDPYEKHGGEALSDVEGIDVFFPRRTEPKYQTS
ncbi:cupin domain-containing protein [Candidatus Pacearchaeota archaeon]|nr:cupin domain-containing protein [Candidatus Pacearchaeota archaeon]